MIGAFGNLSFAMSQSEDAILIFQYTNVGRGTILLLVLFQCGIVLGHVMILKAKTRGFFILCASATLIAIVSVSTFGFLFSMNSVLGAVVHPLITWAIIRKSWGDFD